MEPKKLDKWKQCKGLKPKDILPIKSLIGKCCCKCSQLAKVLDIHKDKPEFKFACVTPYNQGSPMVTLQRTQHGICECFEDIKKKEDPQ